MVYPSYKSACRARGLFEDEANWDKTLNEAAVSDSPQKMRQLFAVLLVFSHLDDPLNLWGKYKDVRQRM